MRYAQTSESLLDNVSVITQARSLAASSTESAVWLAALPVSTFENLLDDVISSYLGRTTFGRQHLAGTLVCMRRHGGSVGASWTDL